jgi:5S rRNA maturation endonuclease (ribonuclease M5)/transposase
LTVIDFNNAARQGEPRPGYIDADDLRQRLNADAAGFVQWLFSGRALIDRKEARIGDKYGNPGMSLRISLTGSDAGLWHDFASGEGGDLIGLYQAYMGYERKNFQLALKEIAHEYLGDRTIEISRPSWQPSASQRIEAKKEKLGDKPRKEDAELGIPTANYHYYDRDGKIAAVVQRFENDTPEGVRKTFRIRPHAPTPRPLYRLKSIIEASHVVLCEGEKCADALASCGIEATTIMGGSNAPLDKTDWTPLAGKSVTLWPDNDDPGRQLMERVRPYLQAIGCRISIIDTAGRPEKWDAADCIAEGCDPNGIISTATEPTKPATTPIAVVTLSDLRGLPPLEWVIDGWLPADSLGFVYGDPGCGKTFAVLDWCLHLSYGMDNWHGVPIKRPGAILYILQEGGRGIVDRVDAFKKHHGLIDDPEGFEIITAPLSFMDEACVDALVSTVAARGKDYRLIVVDTVSRVLPGADENLQKEMTIFIQACDRLRRATEAGVIGVHHAGKSGDMRGSTVLRGAGDFVFKLEKEKGVKPITMTCEKLKDEEDGWQRTLTIEKIQLTKTTETIDLNKPKSSLVVTGMAEANANGWPSRDICQQILNAIAEAWQTGAPWSNAYQTRGEGRYAPQHISMKFGIRPRLAVEMVETWMVNGILAIETRNKNTKLRGLRVVKELAEVAEVRS